MEMSKRALIILADGFEEIEAITPVDILRRAEVKVTVAGLGGKEATGGHDMVLRCDTTLQEVGEDIFDAIILPGGMPGAATLGASEMVRDICLRHNKQGVIVAAICAAPAMALAAFGLLDNRKATCYPGFENRFPESTTHVTDQKVVSDGNIITAPGPGAAFDFGLRLAETLAGVETATSLAEAMQFV